MSIKCQKDRFNKEGKPTFGVDCIWFMEDWSRTNIFGGISPQADMTCHLWNKCS